MKNRDFVDSRRIEITGKILLGIILILVLRLWHLQIIKGGELAELSKRNTIRAIRIEGIRGDILDRDGFVLAENKPGFNARIFRAESAPGSSENWSYVFSRLGLDRTLRDFPVKRHAYLKKDIGWETVAWLSERKAYLPELNIEVYPRRHYPESEALAHILGYTGEISGGELERLSGAGYARGDSIGKVGVEKRMEHYLRGASGGKQVLVNAYGHHIDILAEKKPSKGNDIRLTIDYRIQAIAEEELGDRAGAIVVLDPFSGEVLAMASRPAFDPNILSGRISGREWREYLASGPVFTGKAFQSAYPPGSIFKPLIAAAALEDGIIGAEETLYCPGEYSLGSHVFRCWYSDGHGSIDMTESLVFSCNVYFYKLGRRCGIRRISDYASGFGFGKTTGLDLPAEAPGLFPSPEWKRERFNLPWYPGDTVNASIGQGYILSTPLQIAVFYSALANGGVVYKPRVVHSVLENSGRIVWESSPAVQTDLDLTDETLEIIKNALEETVGRGTGLNARIDGMSLSGKTGTAQNPHGENHAWFAGFAPSDDPSLCIVVMLEHAGQGSAESAPVFRNIVKRVPEL